MPQRELVHEIIDCIPDDLLASVETYLRTVADDAFQARMDAAPYDDEPLTEADRAAIARAAADEVAGRVYSQAEVDEMFEGRREFRRRHASA